MGLKKLIEQRNALVVEMQGLVNTAKTEIRAFNETESARFEEIRKLVGGLDETIKAVEESEKITKTETRANEDETQVEERAFANYIRGRVEERANLTVTDNGAVIPQSIANKIITKVEEICPIYSMATVYNVKGKLVVPVYGDQADGENITCAYATEFTDLTSKSGKFTSVELSDYLAGALTKVSRSLLNKSDFDLLAFIVNEMSKAISRFLEKEMLIGTTDKMTGITSATNGIVAASATAITADELIDLQETVPDAYQANAVWIMNKSTRTAIRKLKDSNGDYILNKDATSKWGYTLFGKDVYVSANMPTIAASAKAIVYGDMTGLTLKLAKSMEMQLLQEVFAAQHALGVVGWVEADSKITDQQKLAVLTMKAV